MFFVQLTSINTEAVTQPRRSAPKPFSLLNSEDGSIHVITYFLFETIAWHVELWRRIIAVTQRNVSTL
ncbi:unnamed protein product [Protopolystoma xenopodis]|uniref:Uncharacterized protein n=1 Tax=Protopolystoma xenopodis TaxID=117903 RepID=A0A448WJ78_9PLAT|nr:unnamed protein product [Protopolystoma xenopodis]